MRSVLIVILLLAQGCAAAAPVAMTALEAMRPAAQEVLTQMVRERTGVAVDANTAGCVELDEDFGGGDGSDGWHYAICRGKPIGAPDD